MTPNPKDSRYIIHYIPDDASIHLRKLYDEFLKIKTNAGKLSGITDDNFVFEYSIYDGNAEIIFTFIDKNEHTHKITVSLYQDSVFAACWFFYKLQADNFASNVVSVQSYAECLMLKLWDLGIDAELCDCDWGLEFFSDIDSIFVNMDKVVNSIITSIKPMEWFYSDEEIWRCYKVYYSLKRLLPKLKEEAAKGRWPDVKPEHFILERDKNQAFITLRYSDTKIYNLTYKLGMHVNGFDQDMSGRWFDCCYDFTCISSEPDVAKYYTDEQVQICEIVSTILDMISYNMLFFYGDEKKYFGIIVEKDWALEKFCLMLDVMIPLFYKHKVTKPLITKYILELKKQLESMLGSPMEIVDSKEPDYIFRNGHYIEKYEYPNIICEDCSF